MQHTSSTSTGRAAVRRATMTIAGTATAAVVGTLLLAAAPAQADSGPLAGHVVAWGDDSQGQTAIPAGLGDAVVSLAASRDHVLALTSSGGVVGWGSDYEGESEVPAAATSDVTAVAAGWDAGAALKSDGSVVAWGRDGNGDGLAPATTGVVALSGNGFHFLALRSDRTLVSWGDTEDCENVFPDGVQGNVVGIASLDYGNAVLLADGSVIAWGSGWGSGWGCENAVSVLAPAGSGIVKLIGGEFSVAALTASGGVQTWGNGAIASVPAAAQSGVTDVAVGAGHALALKDDGSVLSWGSGPAAPDTVSGGVTAIAAGNGISYAVATKYPTSPSISGTLADARVDSAYTSGLDIAGFPTPSASIASGSLPGGLNLSASGTVSGTPAAAGKSSFQVAATNSAGSTVSQQSITVAPATGGSMQFVAPPASVVEGADESNTAIRSFAEQYNRVLQGDHTFGGKLLTAGTKINVYYVHADRVGSTANQSAKFTGSLDFGEPVLAVITSAAELKETTGYFGVAGTAYSKSSDQGLEYDDSATIAPAGDAVNVSLNSWTASDDIRVITLAP